jgi:hypothetical protein
MQAAEETVEDVKNVEDGKATSVGMLEAYLR